MRRPLVLAMLTGIVIAAVAGALASRHPRSTVADPHALGTISQSRLQRILRATQTAEQAASQSQLAEEGRRLFHSTAIAQHGLSCATCHPAGGTNPELGTQQHPTKAGDFTGARDPISLFGVAKTAPYTWAGSVQTLPEMSVRVITNFFKDGATQPAAVTAHQAAALVAYMATLDPPVSAFDLGTMSPAALRGENLFRGKAGCAACHDGPLFTDKHVHNTLVPKAPGDTDPGSPLVAGAFDTPMLRDLTGSAPYMHNGSIATLKGVVDFYNTQSSVAPLHLSPAEVDDIVEYLKAL
jgi:cytochrome c peroxidase